MKIGTKWHGGHLVAWGLLVLAALLPIVLLGVYALRVASHSVRNLVRSNNVSAGAITSEMLRRDLEQSVSLAQAFAHLPGIIEAVEQRDEAAVRARLRVAVTSYPTLDRAFVADLSGVLWSDYPRAPESLGHNFATRDWFRGVSQSWQPYVSEVYQRQAAPRLLIVAVAVPIRNHQQKLLGVLVYQYRLDDLSSWFKKINLGNSGRVFVLDHTGTVAAHPTLSLHGRLHDEYAALEPTRQVLRGQARSIEYFDPVAKQGMVATFQPVAVGRQNWVVVAEQPVAEAYAPIRQLVTQIAIAGGLLSLAALWVVVGLARSGERNYQLNQQLEQRNAHLQSEIIERRRAQIEAQTAREVAEAATQAKSEFLANMSHELRTPLNAIIGFSEVLEDRTFGELNARQARYVTNILTSGRHLLQLINDILDIAKIEAGRLTLDHAPFSVESALNDVDNIVKALANKKSINLSVEAAPNLPPLNADQPKFKQIMYNLISNAIKFTPEGGSVTVVAQLDDAGADGATSPCIRISVSDTGIGIKPEDQARVFGAFEQVDSSYSRQQQGTGLGLALTKNLIELHGGRIWIESEGDGQGSTFTFVLPLDVAEAKDESSSDELESTGSSDEIVITSNGTDASAPVVLVVEDDDMARDLLTHYLTEAGYKVAHAVSGEQAMQMVNEIHPYAVTLDIMLPEKDGWQVLTELKAHPSTVGVPIVIVSMTEDRQLGASLGAVDFLVKPVDKNRLVEAVARAGTASGKQYLRVLVVDDEAKTVELLTSLLRHQGYEVLAAHGGQQGIDLARQKLPDVIVLDLMMPEVTGFEVVHQLQEDRSTRDIPIIIFSAKDITAEDRARLNSHIQSIVPKSGKEELLHELEKLKPIKARP